MTRSPRSMASSKRKMSLGVNFNPRLRPMEHGQRRASFQLGIERTDIDVSLLHVGRQFDGGDRDEHALEIEGLAHAGAEFLAQDFGHADGTTGGHGRSSTKSRQDAILSVGVQTKVLSLLFRRAKLGHDFAPDPCLLFRALFMPFRSSFRLPALSACSPPSSSRTSRWFHFGDDVNDGLLPSHRNRCGTC